MFDQSNMEKLLAENKWVSNSVITASTHHNAMQLQAIVPKLVGLLAMDVWLKAINSHQTSEGQLFWEG